MDTIRVLLDTRWATSAAIWWVRKTSFASTNSFACEPWSRRRWMFTVADRFAKSGMGDSGYQANVIFG